MPVLNDLEEECGNRDNAYQALTILDRRLRSTGAGAKCPAVFSKYDVSVTREHN